MAQMTYIEKDYFERLFDMETGYVLDFTNYTYQRFVADTINIDVYKKYHNLSKAKILRAIITSRPSPGRLATATASTASVRAHTSTTTTIPALCQMPARAAALDHAPLLAAAALPLTQSSAMQAAHATTSQPSQPNAAVNAPHTAATTALPLTNKFRFSIKHPSIRFCTVRHPPARGPGRLPKPRPHRPG